jgi:hypothetical protein
MRTLVRGGEFTQSLSGDGVADLGRRAGFGMMLSSGVAMVMQWLNSPVAWALIVLIMSLLGIYREVFF